MAIHELMRWDRPMGVPVSRQNRPEQSLSSFQSEINRLFEAFFGLPGEGEQAVGNGVTFPVIDVIENTKDFKVRAELPGLDPDKVEVSIAEGLLTLTGDKEESAEEELEHYLRREASYGHFQRSVPLPDTANTDASEASFRNGVLTIEIPKKAEAVKKTRKLDIKKAA